MKIIKLVLLFLLISELSFSQINDKIVLPATVSQFYNQYNYITAFSSPDERKNLIGLKKQKIEIRNNQLADIFERMESIRKMINFTDQKFSKNSNYPVNFNCLLKINKILSSFNDELTIEVSVYNLNKRDNENFISLYNNKKIEKNNDIINDSKLILNRIEIHDWKKINNEWLKNDINLILIN